MDKLFPTEFSITCMDCDAGTDIDTEAKAVALGWTEIFDDDGPSWNQLGICPTCKARRNADALERAAKEE